MSTDIWEIATNELKQSLPEEMFDALDVGDIVTFMPGGVRVDYKVMRIGERTTPMATVTPEKNRGDIYIMPVETHDPKELKVLDQNGKVIRDYGRTDLVADNTRPADYGKNV